MRSQTCNEGLPYSVVAQRRLKVCHPLSCHLEKENPGKKAYGRDVGYIGPRAQAATSSRRPVTGGTS